MQSTLNPYLSFKSSAREAMEFYQAAFGGKLEMQTFKEYHVSQDAREDDKIMHAQLTVGNGIVFMAADTPDSMKHSPGTTMSMALSGDDEAELTGYFQKLSTGGTIGQPLTKAPWGDTFGMFTDKFGVNWMVNIQGKKA